MLEKDTGRPRGFGFITFSDRQGMEDAIREMHGTNLGERVICVNKVQPKLGGDEADHGYGGGYPSGGRCRGYGGGSGGCDRSLGQDECFKCGRFGHWARDCTSAGGGGRDGGQISFRLKFGGACGRGDRYAERDLYLDDRYDGGRFGDRGRYDSRDSKYPPSGGDRFGGDRYGSPERYQPPPPKSGYDRERNYDREVGPRRSSDRYGGGRGGGAGCAGGGPARYEGRNNRDRCLVLKIHF